ncbi:hypothetical protein FO519_006124 [Halicephalobus sp. NKZ332]|nr:hypothetical protein FO519_006124 [Halicephalobus sp. NKZ332]
MEIRLLFLSEFLYINIHINPTPTNIFRFANPSIPIVGKFKIDSCVFQVSSGANHVLFLDTSGQVFVHGTGLHGELGLGDARLSAKDEFVQIEQLMEQVSEGIEEIAAGLFHSLVLTKSGDVYAFGWNKSGVLGPGMPEESSMIMEPFPMDLQKRVKSIKTVHMPNSRMESTSSSWFDDTRKRVAAQRANMKLLAEAEPLESDKLSKLDSSLKKLTTFMKKTKSINSSNPASQLLPELDKLNLLKFLDEIASNICEAKIKASEVGDLVNFVVQLSCRYSQFPEMLLNEIKKNVPYRKSDKIENPNKLKIDLKFLGELVLNGVLAKPGIELFGSILAYLVQTDSAEFSHIPVLLPFCRPTLFDFVGIVPFSEKSKINLKKDELEELTTTALTENNRKAVNNLLNNYYESMLKQLNKVRIQMNKIHKSIKRQERTRGDAAQSDRQEFESTKQSYEKLKQLAMDFAEVVCQEIPQMDEEPSDDEVDENTAKHLEGDLTEGKVSLWPDRDTMNFYESLVDSNRLSPMKTEHGAEEGENDPETNEESTTQVVFMDSVDAVDLTELENSSDAPTTMDEAVEEEEVEEVVEEQAPSPQPESTQDKIFDVMYQPQFVGVQMNPFLENLSSAMNRDLIDKAAIHFVSFLGKKSNKKKLISHFLNSPRDRLDLLPFYGRFLANVNRVMPEVADSVVKELLIRFRSMAGARMENLKKIKEIQKRAKKVDEGVFLSRFLAELTKFKLLPKAEALTCLRSLLVDLKNYKVDMAAVLIESAGVFLFRSPDSRAKMKVILEVLQRKMSLIKDPRQKILLENAYFSVLPPDENSTVIHMRDPLRSYISLLVTSISPNKRGRDPVKILMGIDWTDPGLVDYLCSLLSDASSIKFDYLADVADAVRTLSNNFPDLGIFITDSVVETIRVALETNRIAHQQRLQSSVHYLNWLYVCGVCEFDVIVHVLYQLITLGLNLESYSVDQLIRRTTRTRVATELVVEVWEYVDRGLPRIQLDNFIHYVLFFHYTTQSLWADRAEDLGEFPFVVTDSIQKMMKHIAKSSKKKAAKFAKDLETAKQNIARIENKYKFEVKKQLTQGLKMGGETGLAKIEEEGEEDEGMRQKFERKVNFAGETSEGPRNFQMALMTKAKGKPMLKQVNMQVSQSMKDSWDQQRKNTEQERRHVKEITLQLNERIQQRVDEDGSMNPPQTVPNKFIADPADCHIPAGPRQRYQH